LLEVPVLLISSVFLRYGRSGMAKILKTALSGVTQYIFNYMLNSIEKYGNCRYVANETAICCSLHKLSNSDSSITRQLG